MVMPIKVSNCGRIWLVADNGVYFRELTLAEAGSHLRDYQQQIREESQIRQSESEFAFRQRQADIDAKAKEIEGQRAEAKRVVKLAERTLKELKDRTDKLRLRERDSKEREASLEKAIKDKLSLDWAQLDEERLQMQRLKTEHDEILQVLKLEKDCLDRDRAELAVKERQHEEQMKQRLLAHDKMASDVQKREEKVRQQQETLEWERLDFELQMNKQGEEARKKNVEVLERDRIIQETEARERTAEAKRAQEESVQKQQALWDAEMEKLRVIAEKLKEEQANVAADAENAAAVKQELKAVEESLTAITAEFAAFRNEARHRIDSLIAEHEAKDAAMRAELKNALDTARNKAQELQELRAQLVEEDLKRSRDRRSAESGHPHGQLPQRPAETAVPYSKEFNDKRTMDKDSCFMKPVAVKNVNSKPAIENAPDDQASSTANKQSIDDFVLVSPDSDFQLRDHALIRDSDNEDYLEYSDSGRNK